MNDLGWLSQGVVTRITIGKNIFYKPRKYPAHTEGNLIKICSITMTARNQLSQTESTDWNIMAMPYHTPRVLPL